MRLWTQHSSPLSRLIALALFFSLGLPTFGNVSFGCGPGGCGGGAGGGGEGGSGCPGGQCGGNKKGESQGSGSGGQGGGQALMALAAIVGPIAAAAAQIVSAKEQAKADKFIATTAANAAIKQTEIQASTTKQLAENQKTMQEQNLAVTREIAQQQEANTTKRLETQLAALQQERDAQAAERAEIRAIEQKRLDDQLALVREQVDQQLKLAKLSINTQILNQALNGNTGGGGFDNGGIGVTQTTLTAGTGTSIPSTLGGTASLGARVAQTGAASPPGSTVIASSPAQSATQIQAQVQAQALAQSQQPASTAIGVSAARGVTSASSAVSSPSSSPKGGGTLIASAGSSASSSSPGPVGRLFAMWKGAKPAVKTKGVRGASTVQASLGIVVPASLSKKMRGIASRLGSTRRQMNQITDDRKGSDLANLIGEVKQTSGERFSEYLSQQRPSRDVSSVSEEQPRERISSGAYNAPSSVGQIPSRGHGHRARGVGF